MLLALFATACASAQGLPQPDVNVVPRPATVRALPGTFALTAATRIVAADAEARRIAELFNQSLLEQHGLRLPITTRRSGGTNYLVLKLARGATPAEGYHLVVAPAAIDITGDAAGLFYGLQTLRQLLPLRPAARIELPAVDIEDNPRFGYRGVLLDVGRHFFSVAYLKKLLDLAGQYKLKRFHWHLTDNEGWRIEIRKYPQLTAGASGYYTQEQIRDIVAYAQARYITVIPEIEMPGHSGAALAAYPELGCEPRDQAAAFCPKEETFAFLENVLDEVIALFPGPYLHVGSDEVDKETWRRSPEAQAIIARAGLKDEDELQSFFARRIEQFVTARGKRMIGWDEILQGGLAPRTIVMSWRGEAGGIEAVRQQHEAIMSPTEFCYFDYSQGDARREPPNIGGFIPLEKAYAYEPIPPQLAPGEHRFILGAQANLWTEYIATPEHADYMLFPRLLAFAEAVWSPPAVRNYTDFKRRLPYQLGRLDAQDVRYRIPEPAGLADFYTTSQDRTVVALTPVVPGAQMFYTLDGSEPSANSAPYQGPLQIELPLGRPVTLNLVVTTPQERRSVVYGATFLHRDFREPVRRDVQPGLAFTLHAGEFSSVGDIERGARVLTGITGSFDLGQFGRALDYGVELSGLIRVPADDFYQFSVTSDDGAVLEIDGETVADNDGNHAPRMVAGHVPLRQGLHELRLRYFQSKGGAALDVRWSGASGPLQQIESSFLFH
jgi:hexosaminidase